MRSLEIAIGFDVPRTLAGWKIIGDSVEAKFSYLRREKFRGNVGFGFTWHSDEMKRHHNPDLVWRSLANHVIPRIIDSSNITQFKILESSLSPTVNSRPFVRLRIEGD